MKALLAPGRELGVSISENGPDQEELDSREDCESNSEALGTPRWVIVLGTILISLILLVAILLLSGIGGEHGPGRHAWTETQLLSGLMMLA
jgi:hypothetical protein